MDHVNETESLNQFDLDVDTLEKRIEMHSFLNPFDPVCYSHQESPPPPPKPTPSPN